MPIYVISYLGDHQIEFSPPHVIVSWGTYLVLQLRDELDVIHCSMTVTQFWYFTGLAKPDGICWSSIGFIKLESKS